MAVDLYKGFSNEVAGEAFRCLSFDADAFSMEWKVSPNGYVPFEHIHLNQEEVFHVRSGEMRISIEGKEHIVGKGNTITVPRGAAHIAYNNKAEMLDCIVEYRPGLDNYKFFQCFAGLTIDKDLTKNGTINIPKMLYFTKKMNAQCISRPTNIPALFFKLALHLSFILGRVSGWNKLYVKYTGQG